MGVGLVHGRGLDGQEQRVDRRVAKAVLHEVGVGAILDFSKAAAAL